MQIRIAKDGNLAIDAMDLELSFDGGLRDKESGQMINFYSMSQETLRELVDFAIGYGVKRLMQEAG